MVDPIIDIPNDGGFIGEDFYPEFQGSVSSQLSTHLQRQDNGFYTGPQSNQGVSPEFEDIALQSALALEGYSLAPADPGHNRRTALHIGDLSGSVSTSFINSVSGSDNRDAFSFTVTNANNFNFTLSGLSADADLELVNANGNIIAISDHGSNNPESLVGTLAPGTYYLGVNSFNNSDTNYRLDIFGGIQALQPAFMSPQQSAITTFF